MNKKSIRTYGVTAVLFLAVGGITAYASKPVKTPPAPKAETAGTPVEVEMAQIGDVARWTSVTGSLVSLEDVTLSSRLAGRLAEVLVREGDKVTAGQVIARLDTTDLVARVQAEEGAVAAARARVAQAQASYRQQVIQSTANIESAEASYQQQQVNTGAGIDAAQAAYHQQVIQSRANIESAEAGLQSAKAALSQIREGARRQDISQAESQLSIAQANNQKAASDYRRYKSLLEVGAIAEVTADQYRTTYEVAQEQLRAAEQALSLVKEGARSQEVVQAEQNVRQAEEKLRQAKAAAAQDEVRRADLESARAGQAQNAVRQAAVQSARAGRAQDAVRQAEIQAAFAGLRQAQSALAIAQKNLADASICSPVSGQIASRSAEPGQMVAPDVAIARVVSMDAIHFEPSVPERELAHLKVGQSVEIKVDAYPNRTFTGKVTRIYPAGSTKNRSFPVQIAVYNAERLLRPQMFARGRILTEKHNQVTLIPRVALLQNEKGEPEATGHLFTVENGIAKEQTITLGLSSPEGEQVEVHGIAANTQVIVAGQHGLSNSERVAVKQATTEATGTAHQ